MMPTAAKITQGQKRTCSGSLLFISLFCAPIHSAIANLMTVFLQGCEHDSTVSMGVDSKVYTIMSKRLLNLARNGLRFSKSTESRSVVLVKEDKSQTVTALPSVTEVCTIEESGISKSFAEVGSSIPADAAEVEVMVRSCSDNKNVLQ